MARFHSRPMRNVALKSLCKVGSVVRVDLRVVPTPRYCDVCQAAVDEFFSRLLRVYVNEHAVGGLSLAAMAGDGVTVIEMRILSDVECDCAA